MDHGNHYKKMATIPSSWYDNGFVSCFSNLGSYKQCRLDHFMIFVSVPDEHFFDELTFPLLILKYYKKFTHQIFQQYFQCYKAENHDSDNKKELRSQIWWDHDKKLSSPHQKTKLIENSFKTLGDINVDLHFHSNGDFFKNQWRLPTTMETES